MRSPNRREMFGLGIGACLPFVARGALAFGDDGTFHPRVVTGSGESVSEDTNSALARFAYEVARRTSAPARAYGDPVSLESRRVLYEPFAIWSGANAPKPLSRSALQNLKDFVALGGLLVIDDRAPNRREFGAGARREIARVLPEAALVAVSSEHVLYRSYYLVDRPVGRVTGPSEILGISTGKNLSVLFLEHDLLGALAWSREAWTHPVDSGNPEQREQAVRFAVNIAMYALCSDYKNDQVHAPYIMRRRLKK